MNLIDIQQQIFDLRKQLDAEERRIHQQLLNLDLVTKLIVNLGLPKKPAIFLDTLFRLDQVSKSCALAAVYGNKTTSKSENILNVYITMIRNTLKPHDIEIRTVHSLGWIMEPHHKSRLCDLLGI